MVDYSMCCQTVTVYRVMPDRLERRVIDGCFIQWNAFMAGEPGQLQWLEEGFMLIQPGTEQLVFAEDYVYEGVGPELTLDEWDLFVLTAGRFLGKVNYATAYRWKGVFCHTEAGRK